MRTVGLSDKSLFDLMGELRDETKVLIRQEIELVKTEMAEKASRFGRNAAWLAIGGFIAYAGLIVFLVGLGFLISFVFQELNMHAALANFIGIAIIGLGAAVVGYALLSKALKRISKESLAPEKTFHTIKEIRGADHGAPSRARPAAAKPSSTEMETLIDSTQRNLKETATELRQRLTARYMAKQLIVQAKCHPLRSGLIAVGTSLAGFFLIKRRLHHGHT
jgi:Putative Actinobacterial Holin-X, holin superfamily III